MYNQISKKQTDNFEIKELSNYEIDMVTGGTPAHAAAAVVVAIAAIGATDISYSYSSSEGHNFSFSFSGQNFMASLDSAMTFVDGFGSYL